MTDHQAVLANFKPSCEFFVGIDSDGCAFDTMELKHKECFIPNIIYFYELQSVSKYTRETAEFVNLYSQWRGINRFPALTMTMELLEERPQVVRRGVKFKDMSGLQRFIDSGKPLGNPALADEVERTRDPALELALDWSRKVNEDVARMVRGVAPFPGVRECLEDISGRADIAVVSATPVEALTKEWQEHDIARYAAFIAGQEVGSKKEALQAAARAGYVEHHILMVGDAPGDLKAAQSTGALFFPIVPGKEESSWARFLEEGLNRFFQGRYAGNYETRLTEEFLNQLPSTPPWKAP